MERFNMIPKLTEETAEEECPKCKCDDIDRIHVQGSFYVSECWYWKCAECEHEWGHG